MVGSIGSIGLHDLIGLVGPALLAQAQEESTEKSSDFITKFDSVPKTEDGYWQTGSYGIVTDFDNFEFLKLKVELTIHTPDLE